MSINSVTVSGNLTRDAESRTTPGGLTIASFGVAVNDRRKNQNGEWEDHANFVDCVLFGRRAEALQQYLVKGTKVFVQGKLSYSSWEAKDGTKRSKLEIVVNDIDLGGGRSQGAPSSQQRQSGAVPQQRQAQPAAPYSDADIPF